MIIKNWKMTYRDYKDIPCTAPCSMYSVLLDNGLIDDPFWGTNEETLTAYSDYDCVFKAEFELDAESMNREFISLEFYGLDTICDISLNGEAVAKTKNMHRKYSYDIKGLVKKGKNDIELYFHSPTMYFKEMNNRHYLWTNGEKTGDTIRGASHLRKAFYMSGWDWGPKLPDMGIFRPVKIECYDTDRLSEVFVYQKHSENSVTLEIEAKTEKENKNCEVWVSIGGKEICLKDGKGETVIENPKLWWIRGYGGQYLYELKTRLVLSGRVIDEDTRKIGLRTLTVSQEDGEFCFVINGVKIFAMGANYIPEDSFYSRFTREKTEKLLKRCIDANFNCIRVWGGGCYPSDDFYDLCDRYGIAVWQDFMFACVNVWLRHENEEEIIREAEYNIKRLRHHASLGILCGNNEMEEAVKSWGIAESMLVRGDYIRLYERILPDLCEKYAPQTFYWPSSPSSGGGFDNPSANDRGDVHYWAVWHGGQPFTAYRKHRFRFCSEYGFESFPSVKTVKSFCEEKDMNAFSRIMESHQKCSGGNKKILTYLADNYKYPTSFENLVYASQLLQADAIKYGVEHFRRLRGYCMGSVYWQVNDCWPVASWSSVDYFGRYKALHYAARKFYAPVAMGLFLEGQKVTVNISNETMSDFSGNVRISLLRNDFSVIKSEEKATDVFALTSADVLEFEAIPEDKYSNYIYAELYDGSKKIAADTVLFVPPKYYNWENPKIKAVCENGGIKVSSCCFAKSVYLDFDDRNCIFSDNFFDIADANGVLITADELGERLNIKSVFDIDK